MLHNVCKRQFLEYSFVELSLSSSKYLRLVAVFTELLIYCVMCSYQLLDPRLSVCLSVEAS